MRIFSTLFVSLFLILLAHDVLADGVVFDNDLTKGKSAFTGLEKGGKWENGWWVTDKEQRLVWDAGYPVKNGYFEFYLTSTTPPASPMITRPDGKLDRPDVHWTGISGVPELKFLRHVFGLRLGQVREGDGVGHGWSKLVVLGKNNNIDTEKAEVVAGNYALWKRMSDGKQVIYFKLEWKNGLASLYLPDGSRKQNPTRGQRGNEVKITDLRYAWVGGCDDEAPNTLKHSFAGMRFLRARMVDIDKPGTVSPIQMPKEYTAPAPGTNLSATIRLEEGWNIISLPLQPVESAVDKLISSISGKVDAIYGFNSATQSYQTYIPGESSNDLLSAEAGRGYWVYMNDAATITYTGTASPKSYKLSSGWNLAGFNSTTPLTTSEAVKSLGTSLQAVYGFDASTQTYRAFIPSESSDLNQLEPGRGYWVYVDQAATWTLS
jgi:hypothetical protein